MINIIKKFFQGKPTLRIIHHFACSGGSIFSRSLAAIPNVYVLSEAHPYSTMHIPPGQTPYLPTDITTLARYAKIPQHKDLARKIFRNSIEIAHKHVSSSNSVLILRDHTHADFCLGSKASTIGATVDALNKTFNIISIITVRNPIDSYLSLKKNGWIGFELGTFDEYCKRYLYFLECYPNAKIVKYEDFVAQPKQSIQNICSILKLKYHDSFINNLGKVQMTGESGRFNSEKISPRSREKLSPEFSREINSSVNYKDLCLKLKY